MMVVGGRKCWKKWSWPFPALLLLVVAPMVTNTSSSSPLVNMIHPSAPLPSSSSPLVNLLKMLKRDQVAERLHMLKRNSLSQSKRNIPEDCQGRYDTAMYSQLESVCEDCYNLYKAPEVHQLCRSDCFSTVNFQSCLQALLLETEPYMNMAQIIGKKRK